MNEMIKKIVGISGHQIKRISGYRSSLVHHGIQRSGTNYLAQLLDRNKILVRNEIDPQRDDPRHKHFRWQDDKRRIKLDTKYFNTVYVSSVEEINSLCRYRFGEKHLVIFKHPESWILSIARWGVRSGWFQEENEFLLDKTRVRDALREWDSFYSKWEEIASKDPELTKIIAYEDLVNETRQVLCDVFRFLGLSLTPEEEIVADKILKVPKSKRRADKRVDMPEEINYTNGFKYTFRWPNFYRHPVCSGEAGMNNGSW